MINTQQLRPIRVAIQGSPSSFHETAARNFFGQRVEMRYCRTFRETCESLAGNASDYAVMAIENSVAGALLPNYALLEEFGLHVFGETLVPVSLSLLALPGQSLQEIRSVLSHPVALRQCTRYLAGLPDIRLQEGPDTAACARELREKTLLHTAAIAHTGSALLYGLDILATGIEDHRDNHTRFWVLSKGRIPAAAADKASVCFLLPHHGGSLAALLTELAGNGIHLDRIQSLPVAGAPDTYRFFSDFRWESESGYESAMHILQRHTKNVRLLGKYRSASIQTKPQHENTVRSNSIAG